jgi:AmiR/NasT family two-component response regulator
MYPPAAALTFPPVGEERERIDELEAAAGVDHDRIDRLEAAALLRDARIAELVREVEGFQSAREHAAVINEAKGVLMSTMHIGPDAAFAVLVAASQRENLKLFTIAERIAAAQDTPFSDEA